jgi:hypothetical protein
VVAVAVAFFGRRRLRPAPEGEEYGDGRIDQHTREGMA